MSDTDLTQIFDASLCLLTDLGMGDVPDRLRRDLLAAGAQDNGQGRLTFPLR